MSPEKRDAIMRRCLELARQGWGLTHPNPMVGAAIVEGSTIVAEGFHARAGRPHAEIVALEALGRRPKRGARLFVTLEPCSTFGRTRPCTDAIVEAGIRYVVVGAQDPNPDHQGRGLDLLKAAGVKVETRVLADECEDLNLLFNHWVQQRTPLIAAKFATTIDGRIATRSGQSKWITGEVARLDVMRWRRLFPAIAVGAATALQDRPRLTARSDRASEWCPIRFVFDGLLRTATGADLTSLYTDDFKEKTIVVTGEHAATGYVRRLQGEGVQVWELRDSAGKVSFAAFRERCFSEGITGVFVEGGARLLSEMLHDRQLDYAFAYRAPLLLADDRARPAMLGLRTEELARAVRLERVQHAILGDDQLMRGHLVYPGRLSVDESVFRDE